MRFLIYLGSLFAITIFLFTISSGEIRALGMASDFLENNTMELQKGESKLYGVRLQNPKLDTNRVIFGLSSDIAKIIDYKDVYEFSEEQKSISIVINVTAPQNAQRGQEYIVTYYVEPVEPPGTGLPIKTRIEKAFKVRIIDKKNPYSYIYIVGAINIIVILLAIYLWRPQPSKKKIRKSRKKK